MARPEGPGKAPERPNAPVATGRPSAVPVGALAGVGNRGLATLVSANSVAVQRDLAGDARRILGRPLTRDTVQMLLSFMYTAQPAELIRACAAITAPQWEQILVLVPDALSPAEGSARIIWARSQDEAVFPMLGQIPPDNARSLVTWMGSTGRARLASKVTHAMVTDSRRRAAAKACFDATPNAELNTLLSFFAARFRVRPRGGGDSAQAFNAGGVRRLWNVFEALPEGAVADNPNFGSMERESGGDGSGYYVDSTGAVVISYRRLTERWDTVNATAGAESSGLSMGVNNALTGQNVFDSVVRHEVGHAVDNRLSLNATYCVGAGNTRGGAWVRQGTGIVAENMVTRSGGFVNGLDPALRGAVVNALQTCINTRRPDRIASRVRAALATLPRVERTAAVTQALADPAVSALQIAFADKTPGNPWYRQADDGGVDINGRIFQEAYAGEWWSYATSARATKVSQYQFRSPFEWIAEAYNAYYAPPTRGQVLASRDPATKTWFDTNVHTATAGVTGVREQAPPAAGSGPGFSASELAG
jgi:hypothetical protein